VERLSGAVEKIKTSRDQISGFTNWLLNNLGWKNRLVSPNNILSNADFSYRTRPTKLKIYIDPSVLEKLSSRHS
jgi:hypothetical protein